MHLLEGNLNDLQSLEEEFSAQGSLSFLSCWKYYEIVSWLQQIVLLSTVMELCHVTVAETLTLGLPKDIMPFDLM